MKYVEADFTLELKEKIKKTEVSLKELTEKLLEKNKAIFATRGLSLDADFDRKGDNPFEPGYNSSISFGVLDEKGDLLDLHLIRIWECERIFLGMPISKKIPGSKVIGEFLDESINDIRIELKEYLQEQLEQS